MEYMRHGSKVACMSESPEVNETLDGCRAYGQFVS
ncbi:hypothetical protein HS7_13680 [Sulfolobales archaeon HS-7]|nr:hypothetical protein HS7_13680 [Sulfolobales archaeon HS-7]